MALVVLEDMLHETWTAFPAWLGWEKEEEL